MFSNICLKQLLFLRTMELVGQKPIMHNGIVKFNSINWQQLVAKSQYKHVLPIKEIVESPLSNKLFLAETLSSS